VLPGIVTNSDALMSLLPFLDLQTTAAIERLEMEEFQQKHPNPNDSDKAKLVKELEEYPFLIYPHHKQSTNNDGIQ